MTSFVCTHILRFGLVLMFWLLVSSVYALPLSYFVSTDAEEWNPPALVVYDGTYQEKAPRMPFPIIPFWPIALRFDVDLMVALQDPVWGMLEVAKLETKDGESLWFSLDSKLDGTQFLGLPEHPKAQALASLFPVPLYDAQLKVEETSSEYHVSYRRGIEPISFRMKRIVEAKAPKKRNGHGMNHSQKNLLAVLDISSLQMTPVRWKEKKRAVQSILGTPISGIMSQTVAGIRKGSWTQSQDSLRGEAIVAEENETELCLADSVSRSCFVQQHEKLHLHRIDLIQPLHTDVVAQMFFSPALPDLRFVPTQRFCSVLSVVMNEQRYLKADVCLEPTISGTIVSMFPQEHSWAKQRPVLTQLVWEELTQNVLATSVLLSAGAQHQHVGQHLMAEEREFFVPKGFQWKGLQLTPVDSEEKRTARVFEIVVPVVPTDGGWQGSVVFDEFVQNPFLLDVESHGFPSDIVGMDIGCAMQDQKLQVSVRLDAKKPAQVGGWMKIRIAEAIHEREPQSLRISGSGKGGGLDRSVGLPLLKRIQISSPKVLREVSFSLAPAIETLPQKVFMEKTLFWFD